MKRICANCAHANHARMSNYIICNKKHELRRAICQACKKWELSVELLNDAFAKSLDKARAKHPVFLDVWPEAEDAEDYASYARIWKEAIANKDRGQLRDILYSEVNEFLVEVARGDLDRAVSEAGDLIAVVYRALNGEWQKKEKDHE